MTAKKECVLNLTARLTSLLLLVMISCSSPTDIKIPKDTIAEADMVNILTDFHLVEGAKVGNRIMGDTIPAVVYSEKVFQKYGVTEDQFEKSFRFYTSNPELMEVIYEKVIENLNKIEATSAGSAVEDDIIREQSPISSPPGDVKIDKSKTKEELP